MLFCYVIEHVKVFCFGVFFVSGDRDICEIQKCMYVQQYFRVDFPVLDKSFKYRVNTN